MTDPERIRLTLDLEPAAEPIRGTATVGESPQAFSGWLELAGLLDAACAGARQPEPGREPDAAGRTGSTTR